MEHIFFDGWAAVMRTLVLGVLAYAFLIVFLRLSGKRTLSKMNAFDFIVTIALGSTLATVLLSKDVSLAQGVTALLLLIGLQFLVTWCSVRVGWVRRLVTGEPQMLLYRGTFMANALRNARVTEAEIEAAVRAAGHADLVTVCAVILETDASFSVIRDCGPQAGASLIDVRGNPRRGQQVV
jgi:uncharacterized membrane protein YcaP (DUF421 family)